MRQKQYEAPKSMHGNTGQRRTPANKDGQLPLIIQDGRGESPICSYHGSLMTLISGGKGRMRYRCPRCESERRMDIGGLAKRLEAGEYPARLGRRQRELLPLRLVKKFDAVITEREAVRRKRKGEIDSFRARLRKFGISEEKHQMMVQEQNSCCAICEERFENPMSLHIDHCHESGKVRGLLCSGCNTGLGHFRDNAVNLNKASAYLQERGM